MEQASNLCEQGGEVTNLSGNAWNLHIILKEEEKKQYDKVISTYISLRA